MVVHEEMLLGVEVVQDVLDLAGGGKVVDGRHGGKGYDQTTGRSGLGGGDEEKGSGIREEAGTRGDELIAMSQQCMWMRLDYELTVGRPTCREYLDEKKSVMGKGKSYPYLCLYACQVLFFIHERARGY